LPALEAVDAAPQGVPQDLSGVPVLAVEEASIRFGGVQALDDVSLEVAPAELCGLIGPNGAGKTTLFNIITGLDKQDRGVVRLSGRSLEGLSTYRRARLGMARTFQRLEPFGSLSVRENILAAVEFRNSWAEDRSDPHTETARIIDRVGISAVGDDRVDALPTGLARLVELGRALAIRPRILLLDEPSSGLNHNETIAVGDLLLQLVAGGASILLVEHDVELVMRVCQRIYVLDFGRLIAVGTPEQIRKDPVVQEAYLGADTGEAAHQTAITARPPAAPRTKRRVRTPVSVPG